MKSVISLLVLVCGILMVTARLMEERATVSASGGGEEYLVFTEVPGADPRAGYLKMLSTVLGSKKAAENALIYTYKFAVAGFCARLTPQQAYEISRQPRVLEVIQNTIRQINHGN